VGSEDEARQHPLDFNGGAQVFFDRQTQKIYMKQINTGTGLLDFDTYDKTASVDAIQTPDRFEVLLSEIKLLREDVQDVRDDFKRLSSKGGNRQDPKHGKPKPGQRD
jgi:hypothetical protein